MSNRTFKSQASSSRLGGGVGAHGVSTFGATQSSTLSHFQEPPDYSSISDANLVVAFKNLRKKDSTTKAKALEDLQNTLTTPNAKLEDGVVETWVKLYPRLSIDNARRVRQLAHTLNGQLVSKCGKRIAKHLPRMAGPWLAGCFDIDRITAKSAQDAFDAVFPTSDKTLGFRRTFHESIVDYCSVVLLDETVQTLNDERSVSAEDAEATYALVVSSSMAVISSLLEYLPIGEISKHLHAYETLLANSKLWDFSWYADASVRRSTHRFVQVCVKKQPDLVQTNLKNASKSYIYKALTSDQTGSSLDFAITLDTLTSNFPSIWTEAYTGKKTAISRLQHFLKHGSHSGVTAFWDALRDVIQKLPVDLLPKSYDGATDLLHSARDGVIKKEERFNASSAWPTYFSLVDIVTQLLCDEDAENIIEAWAIPPINQFIHPSEDSVSWSISDGEAARLISKVALVKRLPPLLEKKWPHLCEKLIEAARLSQPEQSKDFEKSQKHVASTGERLTNLQREFYSDEYHLTNTMLSCFARSSANLAKECIALLRARNGKPYCAAAIIEGQLRNCGPQLMQDEMYKQILHEFAIDDAPALISSSSQRYLARCMYAVLSKDKLDHALDDLLRNVLSSQEADEGKIKVLEALFPPNAPQSAIDFARTSIILQDYLVALWKEPVGSAQGAVFANLSKSGVVSTETAHLVLSKLTESLNLSDPELRAGLESLEQLAVADQQTLRNFMSNEVGKQLLPTVLKLEQSSDDVVADLATLLASQLSAAMGDAASNAKFDVVLQNLEKVSPGSLSIDAVLDLANQMDADQDGKVYQESLPNLDIWRESILEIMKSPKTSLSLLSPLGGAVHIINVDEIDVANSAHYDADGLSKALRIAIYIARHFTKTINSFENLGGHTIDYLALLNICVLLADDNTSILGANGLWLPGKSDLVESEVMSFTSEANAILKQFLESVPPASSRNMSAHVATALEKLQNEYNDRSPMAYYSALAATKIYENFFEVHGCSSEEKKNSDELLKIQRENQNTLKLTTLLVGHGQALTGSLILSRLCNELIADLTDISMEAHQMKGLDSLIILNAVLHSNEEVLNGVQTTRLIFFLKRIIPWLENDTLLTTKAEACKTLTFLLPCISDMYGEHWSQIVELLVKFWSSAAAISDGIVVSEAGVLLVHASLKLYRALQRLVNTDEPNDDLLEALNENKDQIYSGLIELLISSGEISDQTHQPLLVTNELLARELSRTPFKPIQNAEELFPLLYTSSHAIQSAAFGLLHEQIPAAQEQISLDAALEDKAAQLPDELLSLIIDAPKLDSLVDESFERAIPIPLQGFLYSWRLLFDHFSGSSYRVRNDYIEQLKEGGYLNGLLDIVFDFLGHTNGRPIDASKIEAQEYTSGAETNPERDAQWLLSHIYYLALSHLPSLVRSYYLDLRSRQTSQAVENWTAKYISPLIITTNLQAVAEWATKSVMDDPDYENMSVKVGMRSKEINVSYIVDEQTMAIKVVLPEAYPLDSAKVVSVNRVAVKEEKWQSWLLNCQGVITFSNGSITDGLSAWRKNVIGALKGQTECAICYSIISADKQLPTKRCPTCKNLFHSSCLLKWFKTSNASTCPLCRNPFNFN